MNIKKIKKIINKGAQGSGEKQLKVFLRNSTSREYFNEAMKSGKK